MAHRNHTHAGLKGLPRPKARKRELRYPAQRARRTLLVEVRPNSIGGCSPQGTRQSYRRPYTWGCACWVGKSSSRILQKVSSRTGVVGLGLSIGREQVAFQFVSDGFGVDEVAQGDSYRVLFVSRRKASKKLSQLMRVGLILRDTPATRCVLRTSPRASPSTIRSSSPAPGCTSVASSWSSVSSRSEPMASSPRSTCCSRPGCVVVWLCVVLPSAAQQCWQAWRYKHQILSV